MTETRARALALYLPQFHPIPENDDWWGAGFTEWTNVARAQPLFRGHEQPKLPGELGFYDLRVPDVREAQADLARAYGIEGFVYWHYWFAGRRLLERPFREVLETGRPDLPFSLAWANQSWSGIWYGEPGRLLVEQTYPGREDYAAHFESLLPAFRDERYITVSGKPLFVVFRPTELPDPAEFVDVWQGLARARGFDGLHLVGIDHHGDWDPAAAGFDASVDSRLNKMFADRSSVVRTIRRRVSRSTAAARLVARGTKPLHVYPYESVSAGLIPLGDQAHVTYPCVVPNWDNTPRSGPRGSVLQGSTPQLFAEQLHRAVELLRDRDHEQRLLFVKSWNEWAEGNYLEPDARWGRGYLEALRDVLAPAAGHAR